MTVYGHLTRTRTAKSQLGVGLILRSKRERALPPSGSNHATMCARLREGRSWEPPLPFGFDRLLTSGWFGVCHRYCPGMRRRHRSREDGANLDLRPRFGIDPTPRHV